MSIHSAFTIPTILARPSPSCLQWSQDGQLFFLSKTHVYILTPAAGVHSTSLPPPGPNQFSHVRWFSTVIDFNPRQAYSWCLASKAFGALSLGSLDVGLRAVACSPSSMTANGSSVAAILSENMDLTLWQSVQNTPTGEWAMICDATPFLVEVSSKQTQSADAKILRTQTVGMLWSPRADFSLWPAPSVDSSLLATGTRAGTLNLFRFAQTTLEHVSTVDISDEWITHLAFTPWKTTKQGESHTSLAYGTATGAVGLVRITQTLVPIVHAIGFCPAYKIETRLEKIEKPVFEPTTAGITALACIHPLGQPVLVRATPGVISLWTPAAKLRWSGHRSIRLSTQKLTAGSSAFNPVSGLSYIPQEDALLVSLSDGTMHVIEAVKTAPQLAVECGDDEEFAFTSGRVSRAVRSAFKRTERGNVSRNDVNRVSGLLPFDGSAVAVWIQESAQPTNFDYVYDSLHQNVLVAAEIRKKSPQTEFLCEIARILTTSKASSGATPLHLLRPVFLRSQDLLDFPDGVVQVLLKDVQRCPPVPDIPCWNLDAGADGGVSMKQEFTRSLNTYLFGCNMLHSLRLRLAVADFCWRHAKEAAQKDTFDQAAQTLLQVISGITMHILCRHLKAVARFLSEADMTFVIRIALQSASPGAPPPLRADAARLLSALPAALSSPEVRDMAMKETCLAFAASSSCGQSWLIVPPQRVASRQPSSSRRRKCGRARDVCGRFSSQGRSARAAGLWKRSCEL